MTQKLLPAAETIAALSESLQAQSAASIETAKKMQDFLAAYESVRKLAKPMKRQPHQEDAVLALTIRPRIPLLHVRKALGFALPPILLVYKGKATGRFFTSLLEPN